MGVLQEAEGHKSSELAADEILFWVRKFAIVYRTGQGCGAGAAKEPLFCPEPEPPKGGSAPDPTPAQALL